MQILSQQAAGDEQGMLFAAYELWEVTSDLAAWQYVPSHHMPPCRRISVARASGCSSEANGSDSVICKPAVDDAGFVELHVQHTCSRLCLRRRKHASCFDAANACPICAGGVP